MMATASFIGLTTGKRPLSSSFYYSDLTEKLSNVNDHGIAHYQITTTKSVIVAKKSSKYGPSFPSSYRNPHSNKALKELIDTASASSTVATWFKTLDDFEEESSVLDYSVEALILLQKSMLEKQWNLSFERINSSDSKIKKSNKKIPVTCSGVSARQRRLNNKRKNQNQSKFMSHSSDFKLLRSDISPDLLLNRLKGYVKGVVSDEVLPHTEVVRLSRIIRAGLSLEDHKSSLKERLGCEPSDEQLADSLRISRADLQSQLIQCSLAREKLAMSNVRLVMSIAQKNDNMGAEMADLVQAGLIGLLRGIEKFDSSKGFKISTYVYWWIRQGVSRALVENSRTLRLPNHLHERLGLIRNAKIRLEEKGVTPSIDRIAESLNMSQRKVRNAIEAISKVFSLDREAFPSLNGLPGETHHSYIADNRLENNPWHGVDEWALKEEVNKLIDSALQEREREIIRLYHGLDKESLTWEDISKRMGLSRERVRQVGLVALEKLKHAARKGKLEAIGQPPDYVLKEAKNVSKFFKCIGSVQNLESVEVSLGGRNAYQALTVEEYEARERKKPSIGKEYFHHMNLEAIVTNYPYRKNLPLEDMKKESQIRLALIDFLRGLVEFDPAKRWSPFQASKHPFVTGEPFTCPYKPPLETPRMPVSQNIKVDHHPGGGHWFAAGLSPNNHGRARVSLHNSPHFQAVPYGHGTSYGSVGSHGSYNDGIGLGSSYGSYGDGSNMFAYYSPVAPSGMNMHPQAGLALLGSSPDARWRFIQYSHGNGLGMSPSAGNFAPLPLGTSPSQFTPPSSYSQASAGSPGHYGPTSPARSCNHGSPLGKMAAVTQFNRRKSWGHSGSYQSQDCTSSNWQGQSTDGACSNQPEENPSVLGSSPSHRQSSWMQQQGGSGSAAGPSTIQSIPGSFKPAPNMKCPQSAGPIHDKLEASLSLPDPGDWDPNYSDELLLQEDGSDGSSISTEFSNSMHLGSSVPVVGVGRPNRASNASSSSSNQRNGPFHAFSHVDAGSPPSAHDLHAGYGRSISKPSYFTPHISQNSPSRLGQQPLQRSSHGRTTVRGSEWNHIKVQPPSSSFNSGGQRSPGSSSLNNSVPWGRRANFNSIPPPSRGRKDFERIA